MPVKLASGVLHCDLVKEPKDDWLLDVLAPGTGGAYFVPNIILRVFLPCRTLFTIRRVAPRMEKADIFP